MELKNCSDCKIDKELNCFNFSKRDGYSCRCKECKHIKDKEWRENNKEKVRESNRRWAEKNPEKVRARVDKYQSLHRDELLKRRRVKRHGRENRIILEHDPNSNFRVCSKCRQEKPKIEYNNHYSRCLDCRSEDYKEKRKNPEFVEKERARLRKIQTKKRSTPQGRIEARLSNAIWYALKENKSFRSWESLVGFSANDLKNRLELLFTEGMTWDRFLLGDIHIDHIVPKSWFIYEKPEDEQFKVCWSLENLQPMWAEDNDIKNNRYIG